MQGCKCLAFANNFSKCSHLFKPNQIKHVCKYFWKCFKKITKIELLHASSVANHCRCCHNKPNKRRRNDWDLSLLCAMQLQQKTHMDGCDEVIESFQWQCMCAITATCTCMCTHASMCVQRPQQPCLPAMTSCEVVRTIVCCSACPLSHVAWQCALQMHCDLVCHVVLCAQLRGNVSNVQNVSNHLQTIFTGKHLQTFSARKMFANTFASAASCSNIVWTNQMLVSRQEALFVQIKCLFKSKQRCFQTKKIVCAQL